MNSLGPARQADSPAAEPQASGAKPAPLADIPSTIGLGIEDQTLIASVLDLLTEGFVLYDENQCFVFCNETYKSFYTKLTDLLVPGTPRSVILEAAVARGQLALQETEGRDYVAARIATDHTMGKVHEQELCDGRWVRVSERQLGNGWLLGTRTDVTEAHQREKARARSDQLLADAVDALQEGFALFDRDDRLVICNDRYKSYFPLIYELIEPGVKFEELIRRAAERGQNVESVRDPKAWIDARLQAHAQAQGTFAHSFSDGRHVWVTERKTRDGGTVSTYVDITRLKLREEELERARKDAEAASNAKSDFLASMSHEFRTPLNAIIGFTEVMCRQMLGPIENERYRDYLDNIHESGSHLLNMVNDLLDFEKIESRELTLNEQTVDMVETIASCLSMLSHSARTNDVALFSEVPDPGPQVTVDELAIKKALINIVTNAIKYTPAGGSVAVTCKIAEDGDLVLQIIDTGIGIDESDVERIVLPFVQVGDRSTFEGTGLGLAITKSIVDLHDGTLDIASHPGDGTTVTIRLPAWRVAESRELGVGG